MTCIAVLQGWGLKMKARIEVESLPEKQIIIE